MREWGGGVFGSVSGGSGTTERQAEIHPRETGVNWEQWQAGKRQPASDLALATDTSVSTDTAERALDAALDRARLVQLNGHKKPGGGGLADLVSGRVLVEKSESLLAAAALAKVAILNP